MWNPRVTHYVALVVSLGIIAFVARDQWFFGDDWTILAPSFDHDILLPHNGHWDLVPAVVFPLLRNAVGLGSYLPFLALAVLAHLTVAHLLWRILNRVGVAPWAATILSVMVMLLGAGAENILWAFQFGFMGAIAVGLGVILLLDSDRLGGWRIAGIVVLSVLCPMFSGTGLPVLAAAAAVGWVRHGFIRTILLFAPTAAVYLGWYFLVAIHSPASPGVISTLGGLLFAPVYAAAMYGGGLGRALPFVGLGILPAIAVAVWFFATVRSGIRTRALPAYALVIGSMVFVALTTYERSSFGLSAAAAQRYAYVVIVMLLPALGVVGTRFLATRPRWSRATTVILILLVVSNTVTLEVSGEVQAAREAGSRARVEATYHRLVSGHATKAVLDSPADPVWAPDLLGSDLLLLHRWGQFPG
jgi:uncharacterized membrane protein